ncbi:MAG TPA: universal stress protein [Dehalococcoidia bacterium]|jgi:nucleotide-binding universal stress UspA family protein|nr:universal stress protein [Dehalococcoidia bacterium]
MYSHILVALDGSPLAEQVLPYVEALAQRFGSRVTLLRAAWAAEEATHVDAMEHTDAPPSKLDDGSPLAEDDLGAATQYLRALAFRLGSQGLTIEHAAVQAHADDAIVEQARRRGADLIAMTTHGRSGLRRLFYGSIAEAVLRQAPCPVLLVRVGEQAPP